MQNNQEQSSAKNYYSKADFWDQRYQAGGYFDWYAQFPQLQYAFQTQYGMTKQDHILMVGCGNSKVSQQMFEAGYKNIVNIDISPTVIQQMKALSPGMEWLVMDATQMTFPDKTFDYVIDKGTMDALIAGRDLSPAIKLLKQCMRVTKQQGQFIQITYGSPQGRKKVFQSSLPFNLFDYYFAYVNLNDMSTMINLMRNNLIGQNGQNIQKQAALQKSMKQFMMIKLLRAKRSKDKQFVIWQNFIKVHQNVPVKSENNQKNSQNSTEKATKVQTNKEEQKKQQKQVNGQNNQTENIKFQSKPQKQSYVYAYSIKRKFGYDFNPSQFNSVQIQNIQQSTSQNTSKFLIKGSKQLNQYIAQCKSYCQKKQISYGTINYVEASQKFDKNSQAIKIQIEDGDSVKINIVKKTNISLKINFSNLSNVSEALTQLGNHLIQKMGLSFHPCPKTYSLFTVMKSRMKAKSINQLLLKYWYPTFKFDSVNIQSGQALVVLSIPPVLPEHLLKVKDLIKGFFAKNKLLQISIESERNGFITFPELNLLAVINMFSLSHNAGKSLTVTMEDFWTGPERNNIEQQDSQLYIVKNTQIQVPSKIIPFIILHLMCLY